VTVRHRSLGAVLIAVGFVGLSGACARQGRPPGGPVDQRPPVVVSTTPEPFAIIDDLDIAVRFDFDERISESASGASLDDAISISPRGGDVVVKHSRRALSLEVEGGFQPGIVYRVTLQPIIADLFGNRLVDPFELVFSTGGEPVPTTLAGEVWNRVTGRALGEATVLAVGPDGLVHQSVTNDDGIFAFRYVPEGRFDITAFEDLNRDGSVDSMEVQGAVQSELASGDTLIVDVPVLAPDTSAAIVGEASPVDSVTIVVTFDDFLDPDRSVDGMSVALTRAGGDAPGIARRFHEGDYAGYVIEVADSLAVLDSIEAAVAAAEAAAEAATQAALAAESDSLAEMDTSVVVEVAAADTVLIPDSTETGADPVVELGPQIGARTGAQTGGRRGEDQEGPTARPTRAGPTVLEPLPGVRAGRTPDGRRVLPGRRIVLQLDTPLEYDVEYEVQIAEVVNINGLVGGGGVVPLLWESPPPPPPPPDTTVVDTLGIDTLTVDTTAVDTLQVDTLTVDTLRLGPGLFGRIR